MQKEKARKKRIGKQERDSFIECVRKKGKKLEDLIRVYEQIQKETVRKKKI